MSDPWLREPRNDECAAITELCLRSKAHWGYDDAFMQQCREELTVKPESLADNFALLAERDGSLAGFVELSLDGKTCELEKLFVDPTAMGHGIGRQLLDAAIHFGRREGAKVMMITADPDAAPFYQRIGAAPSGEVPSGSISGRSLPLLKLAL